MAKFKVCKCFCVLCAIKWPFKKYWHWTQSTYENKPKARTKSYGELIRAKENSKK